MTPASPPTDPFPVDVETQCALLRSVVAERDLLVDQNDRLRHLVRQLQRVLFGRSSERLDPDQLYLALEDVEHAMARGEAEAEKRTAPRTPALR